MLDKKWVQVMLMVLALALILGILPLWQNCIGEVCQKVSTWDKLLISTGNFGE